MRRVPRFDAPLMASLLFLLAAGACSSTSDRIARSGGPDSMGLVILDCQMRFETTGDPHRFERFLTTGLDRLGQLQPAQSAFYTGMEDPEHPLSARPARGLLLLGPLRAGTYLLDQVGLDREFIDTNRREGFEFVREPVACKPGSAGTSRIAFVVEPGGVTYVGRMAAACVLASPDADNLLPEPPRATTDGGSNYVPPQDAILNAGNLRRVRWIADDRTWSITWDRNIRHEIVAWERMLVSLRETEWKDPITRRLEYLRTQQPQ